MNGAYHHTVDWSAVAGLTDIDSIMRGTSGLLEDESFSSGTDYDALNRPMAMTTPDNSVTRPRYNEANLLEGIDINLQGSDTLTPVVKNIDYDAKGQRTSIEYGNGVKTQYEYDDKTFRLIHLFTSRGAAFAGDCPHDPNPPCGVQNLRYTYDPAGNITHIRDDAQQTIFFKNQQVEPSAEYTYDASYRLIEAKGREHLGQAAGGDTLPPKPTSHTDSPRVGLLHPGDGKAMGRYIQQYVYDEVGNFLKMIHQGTNPVDPGWTREYSYKEASLLEPEIPGKESNRLTSTQIGTGPIETYTHDDHGNMITMPHLSEMWWDFQDQLQATAQQVVNNGTPETTYYVYDADGERVRKVTERQAGAGETAVRMKERIYLGGFEIYREYGGDGSTVTLERETLHVMDDEQRIALVETRTKGDDASPAKLIRYQFGNHLGSASVELDDKAKIISYEEYYPYGSTSYQAVRNQNETPKRYRYTGKERDEESGFNYHGARYYAAWLGRWIATDPAGIVDGPCLYEYAQSDPVSGSDPGGEQTRRHSKKKPSIWDLAGAYVKPIAIDTAIDLAMADPVSTAILMYYQAPKIIDQFQETQKEESTLFALNDLLNPVYPYVRDVIEGSQAAREGDAMRMAEVSGRAVVSSKTLASIVAIGAGLPKKMPLPRASTTARSTARAVRWRPPRGPLRTPGSSYARVVQSRKSLRIIRKDPRTGLPVQLGGPKVGPAARTWKEAGISALGASRIGLPVPSVLPQGGWRYINMTSLTGSEMLLFRAVRSASKVLIGRSANITQTKMFTFNNWLKMHNINWYKLQPLARQRWQDVFNRALYSRTMRGRPVHVLAGGRFTAGEVQAAEKGARFAGIVNIPFWP